MSIGDPLIEVWCDRCGESDYRHLTPLARGWDDRYLVSGLKKDGWRVENEGSTTICPDCVREKAKKPAKGRKVAGGGEVAA